jgi:hypothetical protein
VPGEKLLQLGGLLRPEGPDRLLDQVVKQLFDEILLSVAAAGHEGGQVADAVEADLGSCARQVGAAGVDRPAPLLATIAADGIEMLEREAERVDHPMARLALLGRGLQGDALAGAELGMQLGCQRSEGFGRGL